MDLKIFAGYLALAGVLWTPLLVGVAVVWNAVVPGSAVVGIIVAFLVLSFALRMTNWKGRRILLGRLRRIVHWEFWPLWIFYIPVALYVSAMALRFRGLAFTAANPGMPAGGFVGESKDDIYRLIQRSPAARLHLLKYFRISSEVEPDARYDAAVHSMGEHNLSFPLVIKPDAGERGEGVSIVRSDTLLRKALIEAKYDILVQKHFDGVEASVFYLRRPGDVHGRIFSATEKIFPSVIGDGYSTLEELILKDERAHIVAEKYFDRNRERLNCVPFDGENVQLVEIGSHSKGAIFRDGGRLHTPDLEAKIDEICQGIPGYYFGRFDIRAASFEDLRLGLNFRIIELNGVTSESTNIYDPRYSLFDAYRILFRQWRLAFEIGAENAKLGARVWTIRELLLLVVDKKRPRFAITPARSFQRLS